MKELLSVEEARRSMLQRFAPVGSVRVPLAEAAGRVLGENVKAELDLPPFNNSSMDGFAVLADDLRAASRERPARLRVVADVPAGSAADFVLRQGQAARIMTGAVLPGRADAVIPVEDTDFTDRTPGIRAPEYVQVFRSVHPGDYVRQRGEDVQRGTVVLEKGHRLRPQDAGFLAMLGVDEVVMHRRPRLALLSTGDELTRVGEPLTPGKIYESNSITLSALIERYGGEALDLGIAADRADSVEAILEQAREARADLILSSAGVSVGAFDFVRHVVEANGELGFWKVNMRPGKPLAFGRYGEIPFIGLPGNPVSAFVGFEVFVRPVILKLSGISHWDRPTQRVVMGEAVESDGRESYLRAVVTEDDGRKIAHLTGHQGSGNLRSLVQANALLILPSGVKSLPSGAETEAWILDEAFPG